MTGSLTDRKVVLFNGPPGSGKDTGAFAVTAYVSKHAPWMRPRIFKFAEPLKKAAHTLYGVNLPWNYYDDPKIAKLKDISCSEFLGLSPREAYIKLSDHLKQVHSDEFFGLIMRRQMLIAHGCRLFVMDCGFAVEAMPVIHLVGPSNVLLIELSADGCDYTGDSRGYIGDELLKPFPQLTRRKIHNTKGDHEDRELFRIFCHGAVKGFLKIEEKE